VAFDTTTVVQESINEVLKTLAIAVALVVLVMFLFLQSWRATLIPTLTLPVSLIGAFAFVHLLGFSINTLTLFAIVLATGIVVDDAIVVIENIERHIQDYRKGAPEAAADAMQEVFSAVIATALVLIAVFVPVAFFPGTTGRLYQQFALTIAFAVAISAFNALTLTPALSALLLKHSQLGKGTFFGGSRTTDSWRHRPVRAQRAWADASALGDGCRLRCLAGGDLLRLHAFAAVVLP
jgi:HAE1 family hydrophobic/amphiphilic exporter-1